MKRIIAKNLFLAALLLVNAAVAYADSLTVQGKVCDTKGDPLPGVTVMLSEHKGTVTDIDGIYKIEIPQADKNTTLVFSMIGMTTVTEKVGGRTRIDVVLEDDALLLEEAVAVGYGSMRKSDITGSVTSVVIDSDYASKTTSLDQLLKGNAAGVETINASEAPDAGVSVRIRGITSLNGSCEPLYVVDGVIMSSNTVSTGIDADEEVNSLMGLNPNDISSIQILKDASATAIYGASGANGVVLITTKQGDQSKPKIQFNVGLDVCTPYKKIDVLDFNQYVSYLETRSASGNTASTEMLKRIFENYGTPEQKMTGQAVNWQDKYLNNSLRQRYYLSASGHPGKTWYSASLGYTDTDGIVENTSNSQLTARLNFGTNLSKMINLYFKVNFAHIRSRQMQGAGSGDQGVSSSFIKSLVIYRPWVSISEDDLYEDDSEYNISSPTKWVNDSYQTRDETRITPNLSMDVKIAPWVKFTTAVGADYHNQEIAKYKGQTVSKASASGAVQYSQFYNLNWDNTFNFNKTFAKRHKLSGTVGFTMNQNNNTTSLVTSDIIEQYGIGVDNIDSSPSASFSFSEVNETKMSAFIRAIYNYGERYVLTATYRCDGSSRFASGNRFANFPSLAAAWRTSQEKWFKVPVISMLKFRFGWGKVGNCSVKPYQYMTTYGYSKMGYHFNDAGYVTTLSANVLANENLKWETTGQFNAGLDFAMWQGRLSLVVDAYYKKTYDLLQSRIITYNSGFASMYVNQGSISNRGIEFTLDATPVALRNFEWNISGNMSFNRNRLEDLGYEASAQDFYMEPGVKSTQVYYQGSSIGSGGYHSEQPVNIYMVGQPIGLFYGYKTDGLVQEGEYGVPWSAANYNSNIYPTPGSIKYVDMNGDGYIDQNDKTIIGNANPVFTYGFGTSFTYKKWRLSANFQGSYGNQIMNSNLVQYIDTNRLTSPQNVTTSSVAGAWTVANPSNFYVGMADPVKYYGTSFTYLWHSSEKNFVTDRDIEDGSYLRCSNLSLSYTLDLPVKCAVKSIVFQGSVTNLFILTAYSGFSPIVNSYSLSSKRIGVDGGGYPSSRNFCFDLKFTF